MLLQSLDDFMTQVKSLDLKGISEKVKLTLDSTNQMIADADIRKLAARLATVIDKAGASMTRFENTLAAVERLATGREQDISIAIQQFRASLEQANGLLGQSATLVGGTTSTLAVMRPQLLATAQNLERASESLSQLMEILSAQPSQLLLGKPPQPRAVEFEEGAE